MKTKAAGTVDETINKSLDEIDTIIADINKSMGKGDDLSKGDNPEDLDAGDVSEDTPDEGGGDEPEAGNEDEGDDNPEPEDTGDSDTDDEPEQDEGEDEPVEKSLTGGESVRKALEVSSFLSELIGSLNGILEGQREEFSKSIQANSHTTDLLAKSFAGIAKSQRAVLETQAELMKSVRNMSKRIKALESQPVVRKSVPNVQALNKSFPASAGSVVTESNQLSKSEISGRLMAEIEKGNSGLTQDLLAFESTGNVNVLSAQARTALNLS